MEGVVGTAMLYFTYSIELSCARSIIDLLYIYYILIIFIDLWLTASNYAAVENKKLEKKTYFKYLS